MKRIGNLFEKVISLDNLRLADEKARKGKLGTYGGSFTTNTGKRTSWRCMRV